MVAAGNAVSIPEATDPELTAPSPEDPTIDKAQHKGRLVLIEPDVSVRDALDVLLRGEGWEVLKAEDCHELQAWLDAGGLTAVITESSLPDCAPQEILEHCSKFGMPVVFTGHDLPLQGAVDLIRQGAVDFLDKPFPQSRLLELLNRLSGGQNGKSL
jgi:two-component system C4-dicarboxylate transport response regulator DctD